MRKLALLVVLIGVAVVGVACKRGQSAARPATGAEGALVAPTQAQAMKAPGEAALGDRTTCAMHPGPVFTVTASTPKADYGGRTYYFCCNECARRFAEHPTDYVK